MIDTNELRRNVPISEAAGRYGIQLRKDGTEWRACCPFHEERTPSFTVFGSRDGGQRFHCFGCGAHGDVVDFVMELTGASFPQACDQLGGKRSPSRPRTVAQIAKADETIYSKLRPMVTERHPFHVGVTTALYNPKRDKISGIEPELVHEYRDRAGMLLGLVLRRALREGGKETPTVRYVELPDGRRVWARMPFDKPRPLYGLDRLGDTGQVFLVEGEKAADALRRLLGKPVLTWSGGTNGVQHTDWSPLHGRDVILWPDADQPGLDAMVRIGAHLKANGGRVRICRPELETQRQAGAA